MPFPQPAAQRQQDGKRPKADDSLRPALILWRIQGALPALVCGLAMFAVIPATAGELDAAVGVTSDVVIRGVSLSGNTVSPQLMVDYYDARGWLLGIAADQVRPLEESPESAQLLVRGGYGWSLASDWSMQVTYLHYAYPLDSYLNSKYAHDEFSGSVAWRDQLAFAVSVSPNARFGEGAHELSFSYDVTARYPVSAWFFIVGGIGYYDLHRVVGRSYLYGNSGVELRVGSLQLALSYIGTSAGAKTLFGDRASDRWTASAMWHF
jgi:uncharacterized protein (TIGR02001 family)